MNETAAEKTAREAREARDREAKARESAIARPPNAEEIRKGTRDPDSDKELKSWSGYESDLKGVVEEAIKAQEERLKILAPKDDEGKPVGKLDPRMLKVEEGFVRKTVKKAIDSHIDKLVDSITAHYKGRVNPSPPPDSVTARGSTPNPHPETSRTPLSPQPAPAPVPAHIR